MEGGLFCGGGGVEGFGVGVGEGVSFLFCFVGVFGGGWGERDGGDGEMGR